MKNRHIKVKTQTNTTNCWRDLKANAEDLTVALSQLYWH